jgi:hypothetical protein
MATASLRTINNSDRAIVSANLQRQIQRERNTYRLMRGRLQNRRKIHQLSPTQPGELVEKLNAPPVSEFTPLTQENQDSVPLGAPAKTTTPPPVEETAEESPQEETLETTAPPQALPQTQAGVAQALIREREKAIANQQLAVQQTQINQATDLELNKLQTNLIDLKKKLITVRKKEKWKKIKKEIIKLVITCEALFTILYYIIKIILVATLFKRDGTEAQSIKNQIKDCEKEIKKRSRNKYKRTLQRL